MMSAYWKRKRSIMEFIKALLSHFLLLLHMVFTPAKPEAEEVLTAFVPRPTSLD